jgi:glycosyltransferase involved in cell wall biosynthesis
VFLGALGPLEAQRLCARAWAVVAPSRSPETFGLVGPEAMRLGTPVVATRVGGTGEWLEDGVTGLAVPPNDPAALAAALLRLHQDPELARRLGDRARRSYEARFRPEAHLDALVSLFEAVRR